MLHLFVRDSTFLYIRKRKQLSRFLKKTDKLYFFSENFVA